MNAERHQEIIGQLAGVVDGSVKLDRRDRHHVEHCRECQLELGAYRKLLGSMQGLRSQILEPAPGVLAGILNAVGEKAEQRSIRAIITGRKAAYAGGIAVAAVAGVTGAVLIGRQVATRKAA